MTQLLRPPLLKNCKIYPEIGVGNIVRLLLVSQARNIANDDVFSALKRVKHTSGQLLETTGSLL